MTAVSGPLPSPTAEWRFEFKWDGMRVLAYAEAARTRLLVRSGQDRAAAFPDSPPWARRSTGEVRCSMARSSPSTAQGGRASRPSNRG